MKNLRDFLGISDRNSYFKNIFKGNLRRSVSVTCLLFLFILLCAFQQNLAPQKQIKIQKKAITSFQIASIDREFNLRGKSREVIEFNVTKQGKIDVRAEWSGTARSLALILNGPGKVQAYARKDGRSPLRLTFEVTRTILSLGKKWKVSVVNFSSGTTAQGRVHLTYPGEPMITMREKVSYEEAQTKEVRWSAAAMRKSKPSRKYKPPSLDRRVDILKPTKSFQVNKKLVKVNKQRPILFKPFEIRDPASGRRIDQDTILTLPNKERISAKRYYDELNRLEEGFNAIGYSLDVRKDPKLRVKLQEISISSAVIAQNRQRAKMINDTHRFRTMALPKKIEAIQTDYRTRIKYNKNRLRRLKRYLSPGPILYSPDGQQEKPYENVVSTPYYECGYRDVFAVFLNGKTEFSGDLSKAEVNCEAEAGAYVFDNKVSIVRVSGNMFAPSSGGSMKTVLTIWIAGVASRIVDASESIPSIPLDQLTKIPYIEEVDSWSKSLDESFRTSFPLGPILLSVKIGIRATAGIGYGFFLSPLYAEGSFGPFVGSDIYAQAGIDIIVASAGVSCSLILLNDTLRLEGSLGLDADDRGVYFSAKFSIYDEFEALSGEVSFYVCVYVPAFALPPWKEKCWDWEIAKWTGLTARGYIVKPTEEKFYIYEGGPPEREVEEEEPGREEAGDIGGIWRPQERSLKFPHSSSIFAPASAVFRDRLYIVWREGLSNNIHYRGVDLETLQTYGSGPHIFARSEKIPGNTYSDIPPAVCVFKDRLYVFHGGWPWPNQNIYYRYMDNNGNWWPKNGSVKVDGSSTPSRPALAVFRIKSYDRLYLVYKRPGKKEIFYRYAYRGFVNPAGDGSEILSWTGPKNIPGNTYTNTGPAVCVFKDRLYVFHKGASNNDIYYRFLSPLGNWSPEGGDRKVGVNQTSHKPALAVFNDRFFLVHKGKKGNNIYYRSAFQHYYDKSLIWAKQNKIRGITYTDRAPTVCVFEDLLFIFHKDKDIRNIYYRWFEIQR